MTDKLNKDFYLMHYNYYFNDGQQKGEGTCYLMTDLGTGVRKKDIDGAINQVMIGLQNNLEVLVVVVPTAISYLTSCNSEDFYLP